MKKYINNDKILKIQGKIWKIHNYKILNILKLKYREKIDKNDKSLIILKLK